MTTATTPTFSHLGICVTDLPAMEAFYTGFLGMTVTDRGEAAGMNLVFLSSDPHEHHQVVLAEGRPKGLPQNERNPFFGAVLNQVSFRLPDVAALKEMHRRVAAHGIEPVLPANHGVSLSLYFPDPEGNIVECFVDTGWFCRQPVMEPIDLTAADQDLSESAHALCKAGDNFMAADEWSQRMAQQMARTR